MMSGVTLKMKAKRKNPRKVIPKTKILIQDQANTVCQDTGITDLQESNDLCISIIFKYTLPI